MLNLPIVKFEKSCNYLNEQLTLQNNNKQLLLDIISNIGLILNDSEEKFEQYDSILETANEFLKSISSNITSIEQLNLEIKNITDELTSLLSEQNKASKTKEFYIAAFSNIKHNIIVYSKKFQDLENTLAIDNNKFNEFINENNFKYNFVSIDDSTNTFTFTGFSINDAEELTAEKSDIIVNDIEFEEKIESIENTKIETESIENLEIETESKIEESTIDIDDSEEIIPVPENISKIDELTNEFKSLLLNISETNLSDATSSVVSLFKELLPKEEPSTNFEDFLNLGNDSENLEENIEKETEENNEKDIDENISEIQDAEDIFKTFDSLKIVDNYIIKNLEKVIYEEHSGLIYEFDSDLNEFVSYKNSTIELNSSADVSENNVVDTEIILENTDEVIENLIDNLDLLSDTSILNEQLISSDILKKDLIDIDDIDLLDLEHDIEILDSDDLEDEIIIEDNEEVFIEDLDDVNEEIENTQDIDILIDNLETIENVEKTIFEGLSAEETSSSIDDILTSELELSFEELLENNSSEINEDIIEDILDNSSFVSENPTDSENTSLNSFDLLNDIDLLDNFDNSIFDTITDSDDLVEELLSENFDEDIDQTERLENVEHFYKDSTNHDAPFKNKGMSKKEFDDKLLKIENGIEDNKTLVISERTHKIYLPYKVSELENYVESYPDSYESLKDVVNQEFILPFDYFRKHPSKSRFTEAYNLLKNREGRNFMKSVSYAFRLLNKNNLNPAIIASCKTQHELDSYLYYLDSDNLNNFKFFDIIYEVNPM